MLDVARIIMLWVHNIWHVFYKFQGNMLPPYMGWPNLVQVNADAASSHLTQFIYREDGNNIFLRTVRTDFFTWFKNSETHHLNYSVHFLLTSMHLFLWLHHYLKWVQKSCSLNASKQSLIVPECWLSTHHPSHIFHFFTLFGWGV
jgi:hypothetical protein